MTHLVAFSEYTRFLSTYYYCKQGEHIFQAVLRPWLDLKKLLIGKQKKYSYLHFSIVIKHIFCEMNYGLKVASEQIKSIHTSGMYLSMDYG